VKGEVDKWANFALQKLDVKGKRKPHTSMMGIKTCGESHVVSIRSCLKVKRKGALIVRGGEQLSTLCHVFHPECILNHKASCTKNLHLNTERKKPSRRKGLPPSKGGRVGPFPNLRDQHERPNGNTWGGLEGETRYIPKTKTGGGKRSLKSYDTQTNGVLCDVWSITSTTAEILGQIGYMMGKMRG